MMTGRVIITVEKGRQKVLLSHINKKMTREKEGEEKEKQDFFGFLKTATPRLSPLGNKVEYLEEQLASKPVPEKTNTLI